MSDHADTIRRALDSADFEDPWLGDEGRAGLSALLAENQRLRDALTVYADPRNWAISRYDLAYKVICWIGPGAEKAGMPNAMETADAALAAVREENE